jgi:hypothetical protein
MNSFEKLDPQQVAKAPVNKEAFKMLAMEIGLNAACRKLGVPIPTGKSWARRGKWKLPKRPGGRPGRTLQASSASSLHPIADALDATHEELGNRSKTAVLQAATKAAEEAAKREGPLPVETVAALRDLTAALARVLGWDKGRTSVTVHSDKTVIVCDEGRRTELIAQRQRLLAAEKPATGRTVEAAAPAALPREQTQASEDVGARNGTVEQNQSAAAQQDSFYRHMEAIGKGESLKTGKGSEPEAYSGSFGPWPEEEEFR